MNMFPNTFHSDSWNVTFSNIPSISDMRNMRYYDSYVKSVILPDYNIQEFYSPGNNGFGVRHPVAPKVNDNLSQLQVEFKLSEDMYNYIQLLYWMQQIKYGKIDNSHDDYFRKYTIKEICINMLDNQKRKVVDILFTQCFLITLSSLSLEMGNSEEVNFVCNFSYEELKYTTYNV